MNLLPKIPLGKAHLTVRMLGVLSDVTFLLPVLTLIYQFKEVSVGDFFLIQGIFCVASFLLEIPTGYVGDLFSRKKVLIMAQLSYLLAMIVLFMFKGFWALTLHEILLGVTISLASGTFQALLFDIVEKQGRKEKFIEEKARTQTWRMAGGFITTLMGSWIFNHFGADVLILIETLFIALSIPVAFMLPEFKDVKRQVEEHKSAWQDILDIVKFAISHKELKFLMLFPAIFNTITMLLFWSMQPIMKHNNISLTLFGFFIAVSQFFRVTNSHFSVRIFRKLKTKNFTIALFTLVSLGLIAASVLPSIENRIINYVLLVFLGFVVSSHVAVGTVTGSMISHRVKADERATVLSVSAMVKRILTSIVLISVKFLLDGFDLQIMMMLFTPLLIISAFIIMKKLIKLNLNIA